MTRRLPLTAFLAVLPALASAETGPGSSGPQPILPETLEALRWKARPVVVLGMGTPRQAQLDALTAVPEALAERDIVLLVDGPGAAPLHARTGAGFAVILIGKDGGIKQVWRDPVAPDDIFAVIDAMPMRQREAAGKG